MKISVVLLVVFVSWTVSLTRGRSLLDRLKRNRKCKGHLEECVSKEDCCEPSFECLKIFARSKPVCTKPEYNRPNQVTRCGKLNDTCNGDGDCCSGFCRMDGLIGLKGKGTCKVAAGYSCKKDNDCGDLKCLPLYGCKDRPVYLCGKWDHPDQPLPGTQPCISTTPKSCGKLNHACHGDGDCCSGFFCSMDYKCLARGNTA